MQLKFIFSIIINMWIKPIKVYNEYSKKISYIFLILIIFIFPLIKFFTHYNHNITIIKDDGLEQIILHPFLAVLFWAFYCKILFKLGKRYSNKESFDIHYKDIFFSISLYIIFLIFANLLYIVCDIIFFELESQLYFFKLLQLIIQSTVSLWGLIVLLKILSNIFEVSFLYSFLFIFTSIIIIILIIISPLGLIYCILIYLIKSDSILSAFINFCTILYNSFLYIV